MRSLSITIAAGAFAPLPPGPAGAVERRWLGVAETLSRRGHAVTMVSSLWNGQARAERIAGVEHRRLRGYRPGRPMPVHLMLDLDYSRRALARLPKADVLVTNTFWLPVLAPRVRPDAGLVMPNVARFPKGQIGLYGRAALFLAPSSSVAEAIAEQTPGAQPRVRVLPNPIDVVRFYPPETPRARHEPPLVLYTGRVHREKGLDLLVKAGRRLRDSGRSLRLRIVGPSALDAGGSGEPYVRELTQLAGDLPLEIADPVYDRDGLRQVLWEADVYCYPSVAERGESFGVAPLEAMATAAPVVVSSLACFRDFVRDGVNGLIFDHRAPDAVEQLAARIAALLDDPVLAARLGAAAAETARGYTYEGVAAQCEALFEAALAAHRP